MSVVAVAVRGVDTDDASLGGREGQGPVQAPVGSRRKDEPGPGPRSFALGVDGLVENFADKLDLPLEAK